MKGIPGVENIKDGYNPATWMLEVTAKSQELTLEIDFTDIYKGSELYRYITCKPKSIHHFASEFV